jgi:hypothetical protein
VVWPLRHGALGREALREPLGVRAVVVDHVVVARPLHGLLRRGVHILPEPAGGGGGRRRGVRRGEVAVLREEGRAGPVGLDASALRGPVLGVPEAAVEAHPLRRRVRHATVRVVLELPDRRPVHQHAALRISSVGQFQSGTIDAWVRPWNFGAS